jgi:ribokinase
LRPGPAAGKLPAEPSRAWEAPVTVWNLGSINADHVYALPRLPVAGETLAARTLAHGLGGKGANMSAALARAGADVRHIGAVGADGLWARDRLAGFGVDVAEVAILGGETGHAIIFVDDAAENLIVTHGGANRALPWAQVERALARAAPGDRFLTQNETAWTLEAAREAKARGLHVAYAAAPFEAGAARAMLPHADLLVLNAVEADQLRAATGRGPGALGVAEVVVTLGAGGCLWIGPEGERHLPAPKVEAVDTTGAGDAFTGFLLGSLDRGLPMGAALALALRAAAIQVTRPGAADATPTLAEAEAFDA